MKNFLGNPFKFIAQWPQSQHVRSFKATVVTIAQSHKIRFWSIFATCAIITATLLLKNQLADIPDKRTVVHRVSAQEKNRATAVTVGLHVNGFPSFSFIKNEFMIDGILWFKFQQGTVSLRTIEGFSLQNSLLQENGTLIYKSPPIVKIIGKEVLVSYHMQTTFKTDLNFKNFPLENHRLNIIVQNKNATPYELYFESDENKLTIAEDNLVLDWEPGATNVQTGYMQADLETNNSAATIRYPVAVFSIDFEGIGLKDLISLYFPMFLLFFLAFFCLLIEISDISRLAYIAAAIPILVLFRLVIDGVSPAIGYSTHVDFVFYWLVFLSLFLLFFQTYVVLVLQKVKLLPEHMQGLGKAKLARLNDTVFLGILIVLSCAMIFSLFR
jgi:hypothetical protein